MRYNWILSIRQISDFRKSVWFCRIRNPSHPYFCIILQSLVLLLPQTVIIWYAYTGNITIIHCHFYYAAVLHSAKHMFSNVLYLTNLIHQLVRHQEQARVEDECKNIWSLSKHTHIHKYIEDTIELFITRGVDKFFTCRPHGTSLQFLGHQHWWALSFSGREPLWQINTLSLLGRI